jgi:hypothetical protein
VTRGALSQERVVRFARISPLILLLFAAPAGADTFFDVPIVTQVQGAAFYRTSLAISNAGPTSFLVITFVYRSPVDNTIQHPVYLQSALETSHAFASDDIVEFFKINSDMRTADKTVPLFGSLVIELPDVTDATDVSVIARTYSPGPGGNGTMGIAYLGRSSFSTANRAFSRMVTTVRNGAFGQDGNTRANIGFINYSNIAIDLKVEYKNTDTGASLKSFALSSAVGHLLESHEVVQLGNIFSDAALAGVSRILVTVTPIQPSQSFDGYAVQLDNTTNDGSFFLMTER